MVNLEQFVILAVVLAACAVPVLLAVLIVRSKGFVSMSADIQRHSTAVSNWIERVVARVAIFIAKVAGVLFVLACMLAALVFFMWLIKTIWYAV